MTRTFRRCSTVRRVRRLPAAVVLLLACGLGTVTLPSAATASVPSTVPASSKAWDRPEPRLACDEPTHDFGTRAVTDVIKHVFVLRNDGAAPLVIHELKPSCGCTSATITPRIIPPGGRAEVHAVLSLSDKLGPVYENIFIASSDLSLPAFNLWLRGFAVRPVDITPPHIAFGTFHQGDRLSREAVINAREAGGFAITGAASDLPLFAVDIVSNRDLTEHRVLVRTTDRLHRGAAEGVIRLTTDSEDFPTLSIPVSGHVVTDVLITPNTIDLAEGEGPTTRYLAIRQAADRPFRVLEISLPDFGFDAQLIPLGDEGYRIRLNNVVGFRALNGEFITIRTDLEGAETIRIPLRVGADGADGSDGSPKIVELNGTTGTDAGKNGGAE